jgi:hypothetical protein
MRQIKTPIVLFAYNRVEPLSRVLDRVLEANPSTLLLIADGPKENSVDRDKCAQVRSYLDAARTGGDVRVLYSEVNMGAGRRISSGLDWAFSQFEEAIVLEDDLLPDPTFFPFCEELLERYRDEPRIAMISGCNFHFGRRFGTDSYFFSASVGTWGWATWRRAWAHFDFTIRKWPAMRDTAMLRTAWPLPQAERYWRDRLDEVSGGRDDVWDYQWAFSMWSRGALEVYPNDNLISHIGCVPDATHLIDANDPLCNVPLQPMQFPLAHPRQITRNVEADLQEFHTIFAPRPPDLPTHG